MKKKQMFQFKCLKEKKALFPVSFFYNDSFFFSLQLFIWYLFQWHKKLVEKTNVSISMLRRKKKALFPIFFSKTIHFFHQLIKNQILTWHNFFVFCCSPLILFHSPFLSQFLNWSFLDYLCTSTNDFNFNKLMLYESRF